MNIKVNLKTNRFDKSSFRPKEQVESTISELFTKTELNNFLFLKERMVKGKLELVPIEQNDMENVDTQNGYSVKKWIYNLFEKITKYTGEIVLIKSAKALLSGYSKNPFDIQSDAEYFSKSELEDFSVVYNVISWLLGHTTLKFLFSHMVRYTQYGGLFKLDITTIPARERLVNSLNLFNIKPPIRDVSHLFAGLTRDTIQNYVFSIFFLDSFMVLPAKDITSKDESIMFLGCSLLPFMDKNIGFDNYLDLQIEINNIFTDFYTYHFQDFIANRGSREIVSDSFFISSQETLDVLRNEISEQVHIRYGKLHYSKRISLINQLLTATEKEISDFSRHQIRVESMLHDNVRYQIETLLNGDSYGDWIIFYNVKVDGLPVKIYLTRDKFYGKDMLFFGDRLTYNDIRISYGDLEIDRRNFPAIRARRDVLRSIIESNGGKVKIYVANNLGIDEGYQYIFSNQKYLDKIPFKETGEGEARHFTIDFTVENGRPVDPLARAKLEFLISLSMCYSQPTGNRLHASDFLFIMKGFQSPYTEESAICIFDRHGFFSPDEVYSTSSLRSDDYKQVILNSVVFNGRNAPSIGLDKETGMWSNQRYLLVPHSRFYDIYSHVKWW